MNSLIQINSSDQSLIQRQGIERIIQMFLDKECSLNQDKRKNYSFIIHEFFRETGIGDISLINADTILKYKMFLYGMLEKGHYKGNTVRNKVHIMSSFFEFSYMAQYTPQLNNKMFMYMFKDLPREEIPEKENLLSIVVRFEKLKAIAEPGSRVRAELSLFLNTGIRVSELINIKCEDIYQQGDWFLTLRKTKGNKQRQPIKVHESCIEDISVYQEVNEIFEGWLFPSREGGHISRQTVFNDIKKLSKQVGLDFGPHDLRHVSAFERRRAGDPLDEIKIDYGHSVLSTTERYTHAELIVQEKKARKIF